MPLLTNLELKHAESIVQAYGEVLANLDNLDTAHPISLLPYDKNLIKQAIQTLLWELDDATPQIRDGLIQAYVYLEQFIPDIKVAILAKGRSVLHVNEVSPPDLEYVDEANLILREIKIAMEDALQDLAILIQSP